MLRAFSPSGFGSRWLSWENSTSGNEFRPVCAVVTGTIERIRIDIRRIEFHAANLVRADLGSTGCQPVLFGSLPKKLLSDFRRQAFDECRLPACAPQKGELNARAPPAVVAGIFHRPAFRFNFR